MPSGTPPCPRAGAEAGAKRSPTGEGIRAVIHEKKPESLTYFFSGSGGSQNLYKYLNNQFSHLIGIMVGDQAGEHEYCDTTVRTRVAPLFNSIFPYYFLSLF